MRRQRARWIRRQQWTGMRRPWRRRGRSGRRRGRMQTGRRRGWRRRRGQPSPARPSTTQRWSPLACWPSPRRMRSSSCRPPPSALPPPALPPQPPPPLPAVAVSAASTRALSSRRRVRHARRSPLRIGGALRCLNACLDGVPVGARAWPGTSAACWPACAAAPTPSRRTGSGGGGDGQTGGGARSGDGAPRATERGSDAVHGGELSLWELWAGGETDRLGMREGPPNPPTRVPVCGARRRSLPVSSRRCGSGERRPRRRALRGERRQRTVRLPPLSTALSRRPSETGPPHRGRCTAAERELSPATSSRPLGPAVGPARRWMAVGTSLRGTCCRTFEGGRAVVLPRCRTLEGEHARCSESVGSRGSSLRTRSEGRVLANSDTGARRRVDCRLSEFSRVFLFEARSRLHDGESVSEYL
mmetsp:Transcript_15540/g.46415  ORF Transcript_15540/g.46415 Transcript_15540/m.46415 type:complete len:416 (-) Transcript_15540:76-1323(-)